MIQKEYSYIKLNNEHAIELRKKILTLEMDVLQLVQRIANYKILRKSENQYRILLKKALEDSSKDIRTFFSIVPQIHAKNPIEKHIKKTGKKIEKIKGKPEKTSKKIEKESKSDIKNRFNDIREREQASVKQKGKEKSHIENKLDEIKRRLARLS